MNNFEFPTNIKQIGAITDGLRIYVEDYVCSYLQQYAEAGGYDERLAVLIGRYITIESQPIVFINGAIIGKYCNEEAGILTFSDESYQYIEEQMNIHFKGLEIIGWMQSQPGYGTFLNPNYGNYHLKNFKKPYQVMFVTDPIEKLNSFYIPNNNTLEESKGYFVYYDKNHNMHEYMVENKIPKIISQKTFETQETTFKDTLQDLGHLKNYTELEEDATTKSKRVKRREKPSIQQTLNGQKRIVNMLVTMCSVILLISFVLATGLIRSEDRINVLENELHELNNAYKNVLVLLQATQDTFAAQNTASAVLIEENGPNLLANEVETSHEDEVDVYTNHVQDEIEAIIPVNQHLNIPESYIVQPGDNLLHISQTFYGTTDMVNKIMEANNMTDPDTIFYGKALILPR